MTTSGVQAAGMRSVGAAGGVRAASRAAGNGSFADMMSAGISSKKEASAAPVKTERATVRAQAGENAQEPAKSAQDTAQTPDAAKKPQENPKLTGKEAEEVQSEGMPEDGQMPQDSTSAPPEEGAGIDTEFVKSLKLFREASRTLEAQKLGELKQAIMDSMQIDEEELEQLLEQLGANMQDLLQPQMLQQLVVTAECEGDPMRLLTDETAMNDLKMLLAKAEEIRTDLSENLEMPQTVEMQEISEIQEISEVPQQRDENTETPDFAQVLAESDNQAVSEASSQISVKEQQDSAAGVKASSQEKAQFSFEAVREGAQTVKTKEELSDGRNSGNNARPGESSMAEQFLNLVTDAAKTDEVEFAQLSRSEQVRAVADQILEKVRVVLNDTQTSMEISLTPESLGRVTLNLVSRHGALTAHFTAQNQIAKEAIESQIVVLRENLESQGLKVEAIEVTVSNFDFTQNGGAAANGGRQENRQRSRRGISFEEAVSAEGMAQGMSEAEQIAADLMERNGNQVDYTA